MIKFCSLLLLKCWDALVSKLDEHHVRQFVSSLIDLPGGEKLVSEIYWSWSTNFTMQVRLTYSHSAITSPSNTMFAQYSPQRF